ncbi:MAG: hypothetical protein PHV49_06985 [Alistipes sp.]|nr:hypothetical protein [Alistipes sp.]
MKKNLQWMMFLFAVGLLSACGSSSSRPPQHAQLVGADRDTHGCIGTAGYQWSEVQQNCIRPFEVGIQLLPLTAQDSSQTLAAYMVFSADSSKVELFSVLDSIPPILSRITLSADSIGYAATGDTLRQFDGLWRWSRQGKPLYIQSIYPIHAVFMGSDGKSRRAYRVEVVFTEGRAQVDFDGTVFDLTQYVTGSGYGYRSAIADLRGKGQSATLTFEDGLTLTLDEVKP